ncbi:MAG: integrase, partial [SAR324 cluster bacterium]|nr:integrase [SAR324 cluster bacterium]
STYANESGLWNRDAIEWVLAHVETNEVRGAYNRAQYMDERRRLLQWWADQLDQAEQGSRDSN